MTRGFLSDNASGVHPRVLAALSAANEGHTSAYGDDPWTAELGERVRDLFGDDAAVFPVFNGTGANVVALQSLIRRWEAVVTTTVSHVANDESTAPEMVGGMRLTTVPHTQGKLTPGALAGPFDADDGTVHHARPAAVSLAQVTETGTVYRPEELAAVIAAARGRGARVHLDGARLANAAVALGTDLAGSAGGADVVSFGGTKNGLLLGEAVITRGPDLAEPVDRLRKASTQLASKMRFLSAQLLALLSDDLWRENAARANDAARVLAERLAALGVTPRYPVEANLVFIPVRPERRAEVVAAAPVLPWDTSTVRAVASFDTTEEDVDALVTALVPYLELGA
ncbi:threonine aldolase family protein [Georgenia deserti]|uniref:Threonine aldolase family protein n=1 Tax=Georgenia deserti TaxID=2093781 RepID=A0ABW4L1S2_9MICO